MDGVHGPIYIGDFERIVERNAYAPWNLQFRTTRWGRVNGAPADTCTLIMGDWDSGDARNIPIPDIPENSIQLPNGRVRHRGWRSLLKFMCQDRWIRPSKEIEELLGTKEFEQTIKHLGCS